ncbi:hypothetical protein HYFRA_00009083 [Hymenoscyphus fraxineus]|uniref:Velvet domain-containing protein n=1 Tax=Hymenoscyphus fraxineus TaxID=746836 RepID=A0A9N9KU70_9HELO|nr:hypothetical protein HYFRA_00009083 [Hymenoscyphus fraxineus]
MSALKQPKDVPRAKDAMGNDIPDAKMTRTTSDGKKLTYMLNVIQQPQRARACGSGAKSSADRRPVDPPPVVELRIFEGETQKDPDVTFSYKANFFLFATLESVRPIAHGRVQPTPSQTPVLTGMPVSGMAYLDRPLEAGYFIFPDLSVRHEGEYRLSFNLYESVDPSLNGDSSPVDRKPSLSTDIPNASFDWRMEVKSHQFPVYSAKKFPGLSESTQLSRVVAEQGCRVRIRRDVRMRRREKNAPEDYEHNEPQHDAWSRPAPSMEDQQEVYTRERSRGDNISPKYDHGEGYSPHHSESPPLSSGPVPPNGYLGNVGGDLARSNHPNGPPQFAAPQAPHSQPPSTHSHPYPPAPVHYHQQQQPQYPQYRAPPPPPAPIQPQPYSQTYAPPPPSYSTSQPRDIYERDQHRRPSMGYQHHNPPPPAHPPIESGFSRRPSYAASGPHPSHDQLPPIAPLNIPTHNTHDHNMHNSQISPPLPTKSTSYITPDYDQTPRTYTQYQDQRSPPEPTTLKRSYDAVFSNTPAQQPLYNGRRPSEPNYNHEGTSAGEPPMFYKRADGIYKKKDSEQGDFKVVHPEEQLQLSQEEYNRNRATAHY